MHRFPNVSLLFLSLSYVIGDGVTTYLLLIDPELVEANPVVLALLDVGGFALFAIAKLLVVAISIGLFLIADRLELEHVEVVPTTWCLVIGALGAFATAHNIGLLI